MKNRIFKITGLAILASLVFSCTNQKSLQKFIVDQQEKSNIISFDLPASLLSINEELQTPENLETLKTIKKANILAFKINETNKKLYLAKKQEVKDILKQKKYVELMRYGKASNGAGINMVGDENSIDELIIFANDDKVGWLLVRILGNKMQPEKIMRLLKNIDFDSNTLDFKPLKDLLNQSGL